MSKEEVRVQALKLILRKAIFLMPVVAAGCLFQEDVKVYPPLDRAALAGCWFAMESTASHSCEEECFDTAGNYYARQNLDRDLVVEAAGAYFIEDGNDVGKSYQVRTSRNPVADPGGSRERLAVIRDTLRTIAGGSPSGSFFYIRSDSAHTCGPHWTLFERPANSTIP